MISVSQALETGLKLHQAGNLPQAESLYRQILQEDPQQPDALHLSGLIAHVQGKHAVAVDLIGQALRVRLISLQHGSGTEQLAQTAGWLPVLDLGSQFRDFADTAAAIMNLDLVITVDSAVAHCAGALGVPVWVLVRSASCFRWMQHREDSPWYPSLRLFRQGRFGDWDGVMARVQQALREQVGIRSRVRENAGPGDAGKSYVAPRVLTNAATGPPSQEIWDGSDLRGRRLLLHWEQGLGDTMQFKGFKVGIAWQGDPKHAGDSRRSMPLWAFTGLAEVEGVRLVSLQHGAGTEQMSQIASGFPIVDLGSQFKDFADTAAAIMNLDLVITVDSAVAHCAGALGVPVWVLVRTAACWGWLRDREDSPWYPSLRLFRQTRWGDWDGVFARVKQALIARMQVGDPRASGPLSPVLGGEGWGEGGGSESLENTWSPCTDAVVPPSPQPGRPDSAELHNAKAHNNLGNLLARLGKPAEALASYQQAVRSDPGYADAHKNLAKVLRDMGKLDQATASYCEAIRLKPAFFEAHHNLAYTLGLQGKHAEAEASYRQALRVRPDHADTLNNLGVALAAQGKFDEALASYQQAVRVQPDFAGAHYNLGNALRDRGQLAEATASYRETLRHKPELADAHNNLGLVLLAQGNAAESLASFAEALRLKPDFAEAHYNRGLAVMKIQGKSDEAIASFEQSLRIRPKFAEAHNNIGLCLQDQGKLEQAIACYRRALAIKPNFGEAHNNLGSALGTLGALDDAVSSLRLAVRLQPSNAEMHDNLGIALLDAGSLDDAQTALKKAIELKPELTSAHCNLAMLREQLTEFTAAEGSLREALRHNPGSAIAWGQLATLRRDKLTDDDISAMRRLLAAGNLTDAFRAALHFGLAQVLDARATYSEAAEHLREGNALNLRERRRRGQNYDPAIHSWWVERMLSAFTPRFFRGVRKFGVDSQRPIFIFGLPRSGTTLIEQVLASHSQVFGAGELRLAREDFELLMGQGGGDFRTMDASAFEGIVHLDLPAARRLAQRHLRLLEELAPSAVRIVDKMPDNYLYLGLLATLFPKAKFIHCRRDLRDVGVSCWMTHFRHIRWANDLEHIAARFKDYQRVMQHWKKVLPVQVLEMSYEETVANFEPAARRLLEWCGLAWEPACLKFYEDTRPVRTASMTQVRQPIYTRSVGRWKNYEKALEPLFAKLSGKHRTAEPKKSAKEGT